jgi:hypothetical protein
MQQRKEQPSQEIIYWEMFQPTVTIPSVHPILMPSRRKPARKKDLRSRLADILAKRFETRHGLSPEEARAKAERLVRSGDEPSAPPLRSKIVAIR